MLGISYKALLYKIRQFNLDTGRSSRSTVPAEPAVAQPKAPAVPAGNVD